MCISLDDKTGVAPLKRDRGGREEGSSRARAFENDVAMA